MDGKLKICLFLILMAFVVLTSSENPVVDEEETGTTCPSSTASNHVITINTCCDETETDDGELKEDVQEMKQLLTQLITRLENGEFGCHGEQEDQPMEDCYEIQQTFEMSESGIYTIQPNGSDPFEVYCDMDTDGGGWTVFQRRESGLVDFYRNWQDYKHGFGPLDGEHWLGNENLHNLTQQKTYELRVDLADFENETRYAKYETFSLAGESEDYTLTLGAYASGDAGDAMFEDNGQPFSTYDADHDAYYDGSCASRFSGAWWYLTCHKANLNGLYLEGAHTSYADGVEWNEWKGYYYSLKFTEMKLRPVINI